MRVVEDADIFADVFFHDLLHAFGEWAGIADRRAFGDAGRENNGVGAETDEISGAQHRFLPGTAAAVDEADDVERLVMRTAEVKPWDFLNAVSARDLPRALELLALQPDRSEVRLFSLLVTRLRELIVAKALDARGAGRELATTLGVQSWQVKNHLTWARRYKMAELVDALSAAVDVEAALKGSRDSALALRMWVIQICSPRNERRAG